MAALLHRVGVGRLQVVGRAESGSSGRCPGWRRRCRPCRRPPPSRPRRPWWGCRRRRRPAASPSSKPEALPTMAKSAGAGLLRVGVVRARVVAVVEGLHLDLAAADATGAVDVGGPGLGGLLRALRQSRCHAADAGDVADVDGGGGDARGGGAAVAPRRGQVAVGAAGAGRRGRRGGGCRGRSATAGGGRRCRVSGCPGRGSGSGRRPAGQSGGRARGGGRRGGGRRGGRRLRLGRRRPWSGWSSSRSPSRTRTAPRWHPGPPCRTQRS